MSTDAAAAGSLDLHYVLNGRIPGPRAHAEQAALMCEGFVAAGARVHLFHPARHDREATADPGAAGGLAEVASGSARPTKESSSGGSDPTCVVAGGAGAAEEGPAATATRTEGGWLEIAAHYDLRERFETTRVRCVDWIDAVPPRMQRIPFLVESWTFARGLRRELARRTPGVVYVRDPQSFAHLARFGASVPSRGLFYEAHTFPESDLGRRALARAMTRATGIIVLTRWLAEEYRDAGVAADRILVEPDAVQPRWFEGLPPAQEARRALGLPEHLPLVGYTGSLLPWKGVDTLVDAVVRLPDTGLLLVGGRDAERDRLRERIPERERDRFFLLDAVSPPEVPLRLRAADVLVLPNTARERISSHHTSPLKLFAYLASGKPIVASDLPSVREIVVKDESAHLVPPDDPEALAHGIRDVLRDPDRAARLAAEGEELARRYTWEARARRILDFVRRRIG